MGVVSVSMPEDLLKQIDELVEEYDYSGRSEVVRDAGRKLVAEFDERQLEEIPLAAAVTVLYPYDSPEIERSLTKLRHEHNDKIQSNAHSCVGNDQGCIETFVLEGTLDDVSAVVREIEATDEALRVEYSLHAVDDIGKMGIALGE